MKYTVAMAAVAALALASPSSKRTSQDTPSEDERFLEFVSINNKFPSSTEEYRRRKENFKTTEKEVERLNKLSKAKKDAGEKDPAEFAINWTSDLSREEYISLLGL